jgi:tetratricopeptide (TPR) repeat protein
MKQWFFPTLIATASLLWVSASHAQEVRTQAPCSPVIDGTQGSVTVTISGGCTAGITPAQLKDIVDSVLDRRAIPPELMDRLEMLSERLGITETALTNFFRILGENKVATEDLDAKLREFAARHLTLLKQAEASPDDDPQIAAIKQQVVTAINAGDYHHAEELLQRAFDAYLTAARRALDAANKRFLTATKIKADLAELALTELQFTAAVDGFREAADLVPATEPLVRATYLNRLGLVAPRTGNFTLAGSALTEALSIREVRLGPEHPDVATSLNNLASWLADTNRRSEAEPLFKRAIAIDEKRYGPDDPKVAIGLNNLASLLLNTNRRDEAEPLFRRALAIDEKRYGPDDPTVARRLNNLASLLQTTNRRDEAEPLFRRALAIDEKSYGPHHPDVARDLNNLALLLRVTNRRDEAEPLFRRALAIDEKSYGPDDPTVAIGLNNLASLLRTNRSGEAELLYRRAIAIDEKRYGPDHHSVARDLNNLALLLRVTNRRDEAEPLFRRALDIYEKSYGPDDPIAKLVRQNLQALQQQLSGSRNAPSDAWPGTRKQ